MLFDEEFVLYGHGGNDKLKFGCEYLNLRRGEYISQILMEYNIYGDVLARVLFQTSIGTPIQGGARLSGV